MRPELYEIDLLYRGIEDLKEPVSVDSLIALANKLGDLEFTKQMTKANEIYEVAIQKFGAIADSLTPDEVIEGFEEGSRLLKANLSGYMQLNYSELYVPIMIKAIEEDVAVAYRFLGILADKLPITTLKPTVIMALQSGSAQTVEMALYMVGQLAIVEAIPQVQVIATDKNSILAEQARQVLETLQKRE